MNFGTGPKNWVHFLHIYNAYVMQNIIFFFSIKDFLMEISKIELWLVADFKTIIKISMWYEWINDFLQNIWRRGVRGNKNRANIKTNIKKFSINIFQHFFLIASTQHGDIVVLKWWGCFFLFSQNIAFCVQNWCFLAKMGVFRPTPQENDTSMHCRMMIYDAWT